MPGVARYDDYTNVHAPPNILLMSETMTLKRSQLDCVRVCVYIPASRLKSENRRLSRPKHQLIH